jgi:hypothetical protein
MPEKFRQIICGVHGGTFNIPMRRGRPPSKCAEFNPCTLHPDFMMIIDKQLRIARAAGFRG